MAGRNLGVIGFLLGAAMIIAGQIVGSWAQEAMIQAGPEKFWAGFESASFIFFAVSFPLGLALAAVGAAIWARLPGIRIWWLALASGAAVWIISPFNFFPIREPCPIFFGVGGNLIGLFLLLIFWFWAQGRSGLKGAAGAAADLQMIGQVFFGCAAWLMCGAGSLPGYGLHPEKARLFETLPVVKTTFADIMIYLVAGFLFMLLSQRAALKAGRSE